MEKIESNINQPPPYLPQCFETYVCRVQSSHIIHDSINCAYHYNCIIAIVPSYKYTQLKNIEVGILHRKHQHHRPMLEHICHLPSYLCWLCTLVHLKVQRGVQSQHETETQNTLTDNNNSKSRASFSQNIFLCCQVPQSESQHVFIHFDPNSHNGGACIISMVMSLLVIISIFAMFWWSSWSLSW